MNSWAVSACYPQSTFYPLSDGPSIWNHRITMTCFRTCSSRCSRSQAGLCHCTDFTVSDRDQPTFVLLRYPLGGGPPQSNFPPDTVLRFVSLVRTSKLSGRYFKVDFTRKLASPLLCLPPILHKQVQGSVSSCSKGSRGLSV